MEIEPYSIYINHRPFRIAFLVNPGSDVAWIDRIVAYNRDKWGGRFNPIILTDGITITDIWWEFLRGYDPDIICSVVTLTEEMKRKIHIFLSPLEVYEINQGPAQIRIDVNPISIFPTEKNVSRVRMPHFDQKNNLILFEIDDTTPDIIKTFLERNFGLLGNEQMMTCQMKKALETCSVKKYKITDEVALNNALLDLGEWNARAVFPSQICALPNTLKESSHTYKNERFEIVVGDSIDEITHFWNRTLGIGIWLRTYFTQLWLPKELAESDILKPGLGKFVSLFIGNTGNDRSHEAHFTTFSLTDDEIQKIAKSFGNMIGYAKRSTCLAQHETPDYESNRSNIFRRQGQNFHRAHSNLEYLVLDEPDVEHGWASGEKWFADLRIQYRPERFKNIIGMDYWWQLPRRNSILRHLSFFNKPSRINEHGMFSVLMSRRTSIHPDDTTLVIKIPDDRSVFHALLCGEAFDCIGKGDRECFLSRPFDHLQRSDKGMYLSGVLGLFSDLHNAHSLFEERYWRNVFELMSNQISEKDEAVKQKILNKLTKKISDGMDFQKSERNREWLACYILHVAKEYSKEDTDLDYAALYNLAKQETDEYNAKPSGQIIDFNEKDFKEKLSDLIDSGIFLLGVKPKCDSCGYRIWYQIDDVHQKITCRGCGHEFSLPAELKWSYRLNSLIRVAVSSHGTVPVLLTLGQVMREARSAAMFMPCVALFKKEDKDKEPIICAELDLVCIKDGQFVIGEIKQSISSFADHDFEKMCEVAKLVRPDVIIFSSMDKEPSRSVKENIEKLRIALEHLEIKVEWLSPNYWVFDAQPVR